MVSAVSDSTSNQYRYDGHNRRVKQVKTKPNGSTDTEYSLYSQAGTLLYRETEDGSSNYLYLGKKLIAKDGYFRENAGKQYYQPPSPCKSAAASKASWTTSATPDINSIKTLA